MLIQNPRIISRKDAMVAGLDRYFTGTPCKHGHVDLRYTINLTCCECVRQKARKRKLDNPELVKQICRKSWVKNYYKHVKQNSERIKKWRRANPERAELARKRHYEKHAGAKKSYARRWYHANKLRAKTNHLVWYLNNAKLAKEIVRTWRKTNAETVRNYNRNRHARKIGAQGVHTKNDINEIFDAQNGKCAYCRVSLNSYHVDHIIPLKNGGLNFRRNLQVLCASCNSKKNAHDPLDYARSLGMLL